MKKLRRIILSASAAIIAAVTVSSSLPNTVSANPDVYENAFNLHNAITFANDHVYDNDFDSSYKLKFASDCTNYVSSILHFGGGMKADNNWCPPKNAGINGHGAEPSYWFNANDLYRYLCSKGYRHIELSSTDRNSLKYYVKPGDVIFYDWGDNGKDNWITGIKVSDCVYDHAAFCVGYDSDGNPLVDAHSNPNKEKYIILDEGAYGNYTLSVMQITDRLDLQDVTNQFIDKTVAIRSIKVNKYISSDTDNVAAEKNAVANRDTYDKWELFDVIGGELSGEAGFRAANRNFLAARTDKSANFAPVQACWGSTYSKPQTCESFRIYKKGGAYFLQSQANGKWVQAVAENDPAHTIMASAKEASSWEQFDIVIVNKNPETAVNNSNRDTIYRDQRLNINEFLISKNGKYKAKMQDDGNFVVYNEHSGKAIFETNTWAYGAGAFFILQGDGNIVLYGRNSEVLWHTNPDIFTADKLVMQDDGNLVAYVNNGPPVWASKWNNNGYSYWHKIYTFPYSD